MDNTTALLVLAPSVVLIYLYLSRNNGLPLPPGPKKQPLLGNILDFPKEWPAQRYARWSKELGSDVIHLSAPGQNIVVLNSVTAAMDLLEKKSAIYSSRPSLVMISNLMGWGWLVSALPYGQMWKDRRRMFQSYFNPGNAAAYQPAQAIHSAKTLLKLLENPSAFLEVTRHEIGSLALSVTYGLEPTDESDPFLGIAKLAGQSFEKATSQTFLVDLIPVIRWFPSFLPGAGFQKKAYNWWRIQKAFREEAFKMTELRSILQVSRPSFVTSLASESTDGLDAEQKHGRQEAIKDTAGTVFAAGADTTLSGIHAFFAAMLYYPEAQKKAQDELDRVLPGRLPELSDEADLPYVTALIREVLRWQPATPLAVPHASVQDDVYRGYRIPCDSVVIPNIWAMLHDETDYPLPEHFNPDRFLDKDGLLNAKVRDPTDLAFGFGRRVCPGKHIAWSTTWLTIARILTTFNISKAINEAGEPIAPSVRFKSGMIIHPEAFGCTIKPRSPEAERLIRSAAAAAAVLSESLTPPSEAQGKLSVSEVKEMTAGLLDKMSKKSRQLLDSLEC